MFRSPILQRSICAAAASLLPVLPAYAGVQVRFVEGAPKDRFVIENVGTCAVQASTVRIDLADSTGRLVFDVTAAGAGVEVFQPLEFVQGSEALRALPSVVDGQDAIALEIAALAVGEEISFTIDVDDTIGQREITVTGSEIEGGTVSYLKGSETTSATFTKDAVAKVAIADC